MTNAQAGHQLITTAEREQLIHYAEATQAAVSQSQAEAILMAAK